MIPDQAGLRFIIIKLNLILKPEYHSWPISGVAEKAKESEKGSIHGGRDSSITNGVCEGDHAL
jgi:hypothetical protein